MAVLSMKGAGGVGRWATGTDYAIERTVYNPFNFRIYRCNIAHVANADFAIDYAAGRWQELSVSDEPWIAGKQLYANRTYYNNIAGGQQLYIATVDHLANASIVSPGILPDIAADKLRPLTNYKIPPWVSGYGYRLDYVVTINNLIYRCIANHVSGLIPPLGTFEPDLQFWVAIGGADTYKIPIPNDAAFDLPNMLFNPLNGSTVVLNLVSARVNRIGLINANKYTLALRFINGGWNLTQNSIEFDLGGFDGLTYTISATGQVSCVSDNMPGVYDVAQSNLLFKIAMKG